MTTTKERLEAALKNEAAFSGWRTKNNEALVMLHNLRTQASKLVVALKDLQRTEEKLAKYESESYINILATQFLGWRLPQDFSPDAGIDFTPPEKLYPLMENANQHWPTGTNLFNADQAKDMVRHILTAAQQQEKE